MHTNNFARRFQGASLLSGGGRGATLFGQIKNHHSLEWLLPSPRPGGMREATGEGNRREKIKHEYMSGG